MSSKKDFNRAAALTHIALHTKDVHAAAKFYQDWCDMEIIHTHDSDIEGQPVIWLSCPDDSNFEIVLVPGSKNGVDTAREGMRHLGFDLPDMKALKEKAALAKEAGIIHWDLQTISWPVGTVFAVKDPDGNIVEFSEGQPTAHEFKDVKNVQSGRKKQP